MKKQNSKQRLFEVVARLDKTFQPKLNEDTGYEMPPTLNEEPRPLSQIAQEIYQDWRPVHPYAKPYLEAMSTLNSVEDKYMFDSGKSIVLYFLSNASMWRGETAKRIKAELKKIVGLKESLYEADEKKIKKKGFHINIEKDTLANKNFRKVLYTGEHMQLVLMTLKAKEEIGVETHPTNDQFFRFEAGTGKCVINGNEYEVTNGDCIIIPAKAEHNIINTGTEQLKMYTIYAPPHHKDGVVFKIKEEAEESKEKFDGKTTE
jgi:mannose-6-phosphate isomerase-like protein (cupin superfamily)